MNSTNTLLCVFEESDRHQGRGKPTGANGRAPIQGDRKGRPYIRAWQATGYSRGIPLRVLWLLYV